MYSSFLANTPVIAEIHGTKGKIILDHFMVLPGKREINLSQQQGKSIRI